MKNILSFDIEEWFQTDYFEPYVPHGTWSEQEKRIHIGVDCILEALRGTKSKATFFFVGWAAENSPEVVRKVEKEGHEIGVHGYWHRNIHQETPESFSQDLRRAIDVLSGIVGKRVKGYRAPAYTITPNTLWAFDILVKCGIEYDSSVFPIWGHPTYGFPGAPNVPFRFKNGLYEFPVSTFKIGRTAIPFGSGAYFRFIPYCLNRALIHIMNSQEKPVMINIHSWELDPDRKALKEMNWFETIRRDTGLRKNGRNLKKLISEFDFVTAEEYMRSYSFQDGELNHGIIRIC